MLRHLQGRQSFEAGPYQRQTLAETCLYAESAASGIRASAQLQPEAFCVGSYLQLRLRGKVSLYLSQYAEEYHLELPAGCVRNVSSKPWFELCGIVNVRCRETGYRARMKFMAKPPVPGSQKHCVHTDVYNPVSERPFVRLRGRWTDSVTATWASGVGTQLLLALPSSLGGRTQGTD
ncbi:hypothetical protein V5799_005462 [Amblyomma americanum]|uniref:Uncharacterized protein n=1 Tax=Amblyomma americanum TaxID=6943 RepID=A0AAQ4DZ67_AMBAM